MDDTKDLEKLDPSDLTIETDSQRDPDANRIEDLKDQYSKSVTKIIETAIDRTLHGIEPPPVEETLEAEPTITQLEPPEITKASPPMPLDQSNEPLPEPDFPPPILDPSPDDDLQADDSFSEAEGFEVLEPTQTKGILSRDAEPGESTPTREAKTQREETSFIDPVRTPVDSTKTIESSRPIARDSVSSIEEIEQEKTSTQTTSTMGRVQKYSEDIPIGDPSTEAAYPFTLYIEGHLRPYDQERLLDILSTYQVGVRELELEPQFEAGKILIPRISEYAGVVIVQALRDAQVSMKLEPSDSSPFSATEETHSGFPISYGEEQSRSRIKSDYEEFSSAQSIPVMAEQCDTDQWSPIDAISASVVLKTALVEATSSPEYEQAVEELLREIKQKAHRKEADAVYGFKINLIPLASPTHYRIMAMGTAYRKKT